MPSKHMQHSKILAATKLAQANEALQAGLSLHRSGELDEAIASYRRALSINPDLAQAHGNLGTALKQRGNLDEAISSYRQAVTINPKFAEVHFNLGNALKEQGKLDAAISSYRQAALLKPDFAQAHNNLGATLKEQGNLDEAVASYRQAVSIDPHYARAHYNLANTLKEQGELDKAIPCYRTAISISPGLADAHYNLGNTLKEQDKLEEAVSCYREAVTLNPNFDEARHLMDSLLGNTTNYAPRKYIETLFNAEAAQFEHRLVDKLGYDMPSLIRQMVLDMDLIQSPLKDAADLGCGTGLSGTAFRDMADSLTGIYLAENMINEARRKNIYDELYVDEIINGLDSLDVKFDLFIATDVFSYIGDLLPLFNCVNKHSKKDSLFVFSTEHIEHDHFVLQRTGRFAHSKDYILSVAAKSGFRLEHWKTAKLRKEKGHWIIDGIYALRYGASLAA
jgi:predicted TPR repeat methyltransferase